MCQQNNADLVSIHSHLENTLVSGEFILEKRFRLFLDLSNAIMNGWGVVTGLQCNNGSCFWVDSTPFDYGVFFGPYARPYNGDQWCTLLVADQQSNDCDVAENNEQAQYWNTVPCEGLIWPALCQKNPTITTVSMKTRAQRLPILQHGLKRSGATNVRF